MRIVHFLTPSFNKIIMAIRALVTYDFICAALVQRIRRKINFPFFDHTSELIGVWCVVTTCRRISGYAD